MGDDAPTAVGEARQVLAVVVGAIVFYLCLGVVILVTDWALSALTNSDGTISGSYIVAWVLGAGLSSSLGVEAAKLVAATFNRIGLIVLMIVPIVVFAIVTYLQAAIFSTHTIYAVLCALAGTAFGLGMTIRGKHNVRTDLRTRPTSGPGAVACDCSTAVRTFRVLKILRRSQFAVSANDVGHRCSMSAHMHRRWSIFLGRFSRPAPVGSPVIQSR